MSDFEGRLTAALTEGAEQVDAIGLADGARKRSRVLLRRRAVAGAAAATVVIAVSLGLVGALGSDDATTDGLAAPTTRDGGPGWKTAELWQTIEHAGVEVDVPEAWTELDTAECDVSTVGVADFEVGLPRPPTSGVHPCDATFGLRISDVTPFDPVVGLTDIGGEVVVGDQLLQIKTGDRDLARRILTSARPTGTTPIEVDTWSVLDLGDSVTAEVPDGADVRVARTGGIPACAIGSTSSPARPTDDGQWRAFHCRNVIVTVIAPTEALATIIAATVDDARR